MVDALREHRSAELLVPMQQDIVVPRQRRELLREIIVQNILIEELALSRILREEPQPRQQDVAALAQTVEIHEQHAGVETVRERHARLRHAVVDLFLGLLRAFRMIVREQRPLAHRRHAGRADLLPPELLDIHVNDRIGIEIDEPMHLGGQRLRRQEAVERRLRVARIPHRLMENLLRLTQHSRLLLADIVKPELLPVRAHHLPQALLILRRERAIVEDVKDNRRLGMLHDGEHRRAEELRIRSLLVRKRIEDMNFFADNPSFILLQSL